MNEADRFWSHVNKSKGVCWNWMGYIRKNGYGQFRIGSAADGTRRMVMSHRYSYASCCGDVPDGMMVCHSCDNRRCVNPDHLFIGTAKDNNSDCAKKDRNSRGERHGMSKLRRENVIAIKDDTRPQRQIARDYSVSQNVISRIKSGKIWVEA